MKKILIGLSVFLIFNSVSFADCCKDSTAIAPVSNQKACQTIFSFMALDLSILSPRATAADVHVCSPKNMMPWMHRFMPKCCRPGCCPQQPCNQACAPQCCPACPQCCPECCPDEQPCCPQSSCPQCCPQSCPQCCPCTPQCPGCNKSMAPTDDKQAEIKPVCDKKTLKPANNKQIIKKVICNKKNIAAVDNIQTAASEDNKQLIPVGNIQSATNTGTTEQLIKTDEQTNINPVCDKADTGLCGCVNTSPSLFRIDLLRLFKFEIH